MDPTAPVKNYVFVRGGHSHKPPGEELDAFVVDINGHPASATLCDTLQLDGWSVHRVTHPSVSNASNCTYVAGEALRFFFNTPVKDWDYFAGTACVFQDTTTALPQSCSSRFVLGGERCT